MTKEMLKSLTAGDRELASRVSPKLGETALIRKLIELWAKSELSPRELAEKLGCSKYRLNKILHGTDADLTLGELHKFSEAVGGQAVLFMADVTIADGVHIQRMVDMEEGLGCLKCHFRKHNHCTLPAELHTYFCGESEFHWEEVREQ